MSRRTALKTPSSAHQVDGRALLQAKALAFSYQHTALLQEINLSLHARQVVALAGANGTGKSTLVRLLRGELKPTAGAVSRHGSIAELEQTAATKALPSSAHMSHRLWQHQPRLRALAQRLRNEDWAAAAEFAELGGYEVEAIIERLLEDFGLSTTANTTPELGPPSRLSPGQRQRIELVALFASDAEVLILDEPSNHLDLAAALALQHTIEHAANSGKAILLISHDRHLVDQVATHTAYLQDGKLTTVLGGYSENLTHRRRLSAAQAQRAAATRKRIASLEEEVVRRSRWAQRKEASKRGAGAAKPHIAKQAKKMARRAKDGKRRLQNEIDALKREAPRRQRANRLSFETASTKRRSIAHLRKASVSFSKGPQDDPQRVLIDLDLNLHTSDRVALLGVNGGGKSTLLKLVAGALSPTSGSVQRADNVAAGVLHQDLAGSFAKPTLLDSLQASMPTEDWDEARARTHLATVGLRGAQAFSRIEELSSGERMRAALVQLALRPRDFLILDEPTNHLDVETVEVLEQVLQDFGGGFLLVTHDRRLVDNVAERVLVLEDGRLREL